MALSAFEDRLVMPVDSPYRLNPAAVIPCSPKLRADLRFHARPGEDAHVIVEDPQRGQFYRVGVSEYALLAEFDGQTPLDVALARARQLQPALQLTLAQAAVLAQWLESTQLAHSSKPVDAAQWTRLSKPEADARAKSRFNPFFIRIPLLHPDRLIEALVPFFGWWFSLPATIVTLAGCIWAMAPLAAQWRDVMADLENVFTPHRQVTLAAIWLVMKILHELGHGMACKRYGGYVREAGITFILFAPAAYIDVTSSWRFASRWQRIHTSAAGMYVEIAISALAAVVWESSSSGPLRQVAADVILLGAISTVLFNLNPLMRFDGYYIFSDLLELQNPFDSGRSFLNYCGKRYLLGMRVPAPRLPARRATLVKVYGFASAVWYFLAKLGTLAAMAILFHGFGLFVALLGFVWWYVIPSVRLMRWMFQGPAAQRPTTGRALFATIAACASAVFVLALVPASLPATAPAIVEYAPPTVIRARAAGFVQQIPIAEGEMVQAGQLLCVLRNEELAVELASAKSHFARAEVRALALRQRLPHAPQEHVAYEAAMSDLTALATRINELQSRWADLEVRAPHAGQVVRRRLDRLQGTYLRIGDEIAALGSEDSKRLHVSLAQDEVESLSQVENCPVTVYMPGIESWQATLDRLDPRASTQPPHPAFAAPNGGALPVVRSGNSFELTTPRFSGFVALSADESLRVRSGQRASVSIGRRAESLGGWLMRSYERIWDQAIHAGQ